LSFKQNPGQSELNEFNMLIKKGKKKKSGLTEGQSRGFWRIFFRENEEYSSFKE